MKKISVVTGGTGGIGFACAKIIGEKMGVLVSDIQQNKVDEAVAYLRKAGVYAEGMVCDIADHASVQALAEKAAKMGDVAAVYNIAGLSPSNYAPADLIMKVNAFGTLNVNQEFEKIMNGGCLLNISSTVAYWLPEAATPYAVYDLAFTDIEQFKAKMLELATNSGMSYALSKTFVKYLTKKSAYRLGREKGIRIVSVAPGVIDTPMTQNEESDRAKISAMSFCALNRIGKPEELAFSFVVLADERNSYVTGVDLLVDGGCLAEGYNGTNTRGAQEKEISLAELSAQKTT